MANRIRSAALAALFLAIGPIGFVHDSSGQIRIFLNRTNVTGGYVSFSQHGQHSIRRGLWILALAAGPIANLLLTALCGTLFFTPARAYQISGSTVDRFAAVFLLVTAFVSSIGFVASMVPADSGLHSTDGKRIFTLLTDRSALKQDQIAEYLRVFPFSTQQYGQLDSEDLVALQNSKIRSYRFLGHYIAAKRALQLSDDADALEAASKAFELAQSISVKVRFSAGALLLAIESIHCGKMKNSTAIAAESQSFLSASDQALFSAAKALGEGKPAEAQSLAEGFLQQESWNAPQTAEAHFDCVLAGRIRGAAEQALGHAI